ncbi:MAG TPA: hypothetical protein VM557_01930 [Thermoanaerobaculia bacterium]|nr:hypothetical protein [Thermoanaerobaculia bacterium]
MAPIEILIPTFNRAGPLRRNLRWLAHLIHGEALEGVFRLLVSDAVAPEAEAAEHEKWLGEA